MTVTNIGSGLGSSLGSVIEASYGAGGTVNAWHPFDSCQVKFNPTYFDGKGLRAGALVQESGGHKLVQGDATGTAKTDVYYSGIGRWIAVLFGSVTSGAPALVSGSTDAYKQTHAWGNPKGQSLAFQQGVPEVGGTVKNWMTTGVKLTQGEFTCTNGKSLDATFTIDAQDRYEATPDITTPVFPASDAFFTWRDMVVQVGAYGSEAQIDGVRTWKGTFKRSMDTARWNAGNLTASGITPSYAVKDEPVDHEFSEITGELDMEYLDDTLVDYFRNTGNFSLIVAFTSQVDIDAGTNPYEISFAFPCCYLIGDDPEIAGPDLVKPQMKFVVRDDDTHNPATITVVSKESAL